MFSEMGLSDKEYVCSLSPDTEKFAKQDLREDEATRNHGIKAMREWLEQNSDITNCRTGKSLANCARILIGSY